MTNWEMIDTVQRMQDYIGQNIDDAMFDQNALYTYIGYTKRHADRMFRQLIGMTPLEYIRKLRLSLSAPMLLDGDRSILDVALSSSFDSHEGYTKAFSSAFGATPRDYRRGKTPIPLFIGYPIRDSILHFNDRGESNMEKTPFICNVTAVGRPARKLMLMRSKKAEDYWSYCEEMGCDWEGLFNSIPGKLDTAAILELPEFLMKDGFGAVASGVELPASYDGAIPDGCELADLPPCELMYFQSERFESDEQFYQALAAVFRARETYDFEAYGFAEAPDTAPSFNFGGSAGRGAKIAIPVKRI